MGRRNFSATTVLTMLFLGAGILAAEAADGNAATPPAQSLPAIVVTEATERHLVDRIVATGSIRAVEEVHTQPEVEGLRIRTLNADTGDRVNEGDVLAVLADDSLLLQKSQLAATRAKAEASLAQLQAQLVEAQANAGEAERQHRRAVTLSTRGTVSTAQVEQAESAAATAAARVKAAEQAIAVAEAELNVVDAQISDVDLRLARTDVKAQVGGVIAARNARIGAIASGAGQPLFTIIRGGEIELVADVSESDILRIRPGQKATLRVAGGREPLRGAVRLVSPTVDPVTRLGSVHIAIDDDERARAGMYASAEIVLAEVTGVSLPLSAVTTGRDGTTVRIVEDGTVRQVRIDTGIQDGGFVEVLGGLTAGTDVVAKAGAFVRDGDRIAPVRQAAGAAAAPGTD